MEGSPLDAIDTLDLAELLDFAADALSSAGADIVHPDLQAHLRRWARRLGPDHPGWTWASPPAQPEPPGDRDPGDRGGQSLTLVPGSIGRPETPSCHDAVTMVCPVDQRRFVPVGRQKYCGDPCRAAAYRQRRDASAPPVDIPKTKPRRSITVYECDRCGERALGDQRCDTCSTFMRRVGVGGSCPACDDPVAVTELVEGAES